jgi:hypothetical protein
MNEIKFNLLKHSAGIAKAVQPKNSSAANANADGDTFQHSGIPDLSEIEAQLESEFASKRASLARALRSDTYPTAEVRDRLASFFSTALARKPSLGAE